MRCRAQRRQFYRIYACRQQPGTNETVEVDHYLMQRALSTDYYYYIVMTPFFTYRVI